MDDNSKALKEDNQKNMEMLNKKMDDNSKALKEDSQRNIESLNEKLNKKLDDISKKMEENNVKINSKIEGVIAVVRRERSLKYTRGANNTTTSCSKLEKRSMDVSII